MTCASIVASVLYGLLAFEPAHAATPATQPANAVGEALKLEPLSLQSQPVAHFEYTAVGVAHAYALYISAAPATRPATGPAMEFEKYQLVILRAGDNPPQIPREEAMEIQKQHLAHMSGLARQGKILVAGPFSDQPDKTMRGMCIYRCASIAEARQLAEGDPAVKAGRLKVEVLTWNVEKGYMTFPKSPGVEEK